MDVNSGETTLWHEEGKVVSEPVFVAAPGAIKEDEGVVLSTLLDMVSLSWGFCIDSILCDILKSTILPRKVNTKLRNFRKRPRFLYRFPIPNISFLTIIRSCYYDLIPNQQSKSVLSESIFNQYFQNNTRFVALLVLDPITWTEIARVEFEANGTVTSSFHGLFAATNEKIHMY